MLPSGLMSGFLSVLMSVLMSVATHHGEAADPDLLEWIKNLLDDIFNIGPWLAVAALAIIILLIPAAIITVFLIQRRRHPTEQPASPEGEDAQGG